MRLLFAVPLLLVAVSSVLAAPAPTATPVQATSIETIYEDVTRTVIHTVTDPTPTHAPVNMTLAEARAELDRIQKELDEQKAYIATIDGTTTVTASPEGPNAVPDHTAADAPTTIRMCDCKEADACRKESMNEMDTCMESCDAHIEDYGKKTESYLKCFTKFNATIVEAESCLFEGKKDFCNSGKDNKTIDITNWDDLTNIAYSPAAEGKEDAVWTKHEPKHTKMQEFFTCTKNCMHKKLNACTADKGCAVEMPTPNELETKMMACTKENYKITNAIYNTCYCLAWQEGVKDLQGSCAFFGNQYYVDKA